MSKKTGAAFRPVDVNERRNGKPQKDLRVPIIILLILILIAVIAAFAIIKNIGDASDDRTEVEEQKEEIEKENIITDDLLTSVCADFFDAYTGCDSAATGALLAGMGEPYSFGELTSLIASNTEVEIGEGNITDEENGTVAVTLTTVDLVTVITEMPDDISSKEEANAALKEKLTADAPKKSFDVDVKLTKNADGQWKVVITDELSDAMMGGLFSYLMESEVTE